MANIKIRKIFFDVVLNILKLYTKHKRVFRVKNYFHLTSIHWAMHRKSLDWLTRTGLSDNTNDEYENSNSII